MTADRANALSPLEAARLYASGGLGAAWPVFPVGADKRPHPCLPPRPRGEGGFRLATVDREQIADWWSAHPDAGIGVDLGRAGLAVIDLEGPDKGVDPMTVLDQVLAVVQLPVTLTAQTPGGGWHFYYRVPHGASVRTRIAGPDGVPVVGVEIRRAGNYVVLPPSQRADDRGWEWWTWGPPEPAPAWMLEEHRPARGIATGPGPRLFPPDRQGTPFGVGALKAGAAKVRGAPEGTRHLTLASIGSWLFEVARDGHLDARVVLDELLDAARGAGLPNNETEDVLEWAIERGLGGPPMAPESARETA